jgi:epoxyqueuosine reductase
MGALDIGTSRLDAEPAPPAFSGYQTAISIACRFPPVLIDELIDGPSVEYLHAYRLVNRMIDLITLRLANELSLRGFRARPIPASKIVERKELRASFPHIIAGINAGLGWLGKNNTLVHPVGGPRVRLGSVLTDAALPVEHAPIASRCGACDRWVTACPARALESARAPEQYNEGFDCPACDRYHQLVSSIFGKRLCGLCIAVCPVGASFSGEKWPLPHGFWYRILDTAMGRSIREGTVEHV